MTWLVPALLSAVFAALTAILAKIGVKNIDSNLATAIRTVVILLFAWGIVWTQGSAKELGNLSKTSILFLVLSGITTGLSWIFYFRALQIGKATQVAPVDRLSLVITMILAVIFLKEKMSVGAVVGTILMVMGAVLTTL